ncbi:MAG: oligosaccharide flippase family protein [Candidatus Cloacimonetes bacterium]|nr:oligosaccharide flippase family protein [Candidatus Cloacimonadota bacterium]
MKAFIKRHISSYKLKQIFSLYVATMFTMVLGLGVSKLNTHLLTTLEYGSLKYIESVFMLTATLLSFGLFPTLSTLTPRFNNTERKARFFGMSLVFFLIVSGFISLCIFGFAFIQPLIFEQNLRWLFAASAILAIGIPSRQYIEGILSGDNQIHKLALYKIMPQTIYILVALVIAYLFTYNIAIAWFLRLISMIVSLCVILITLKPKFTGLRKYSKLILRYNKKKGIHVYFGTLFGVVSAQLSPLFISYFTSDNTNVGYFSLARNIALPLALIPITLGHTFFKEFATSSRIKPKVLFASLMITLSTLVIFLFTIKPFMLWVFGTDYTEAANISRIIVVGTVALGYGDFFRRFLWAHGQGKSIRNGAIVAGSVTFLGNVFAIAKWGVNGAAFTLIAASTAYLLCMMLSYFIYIRRINRKTTYGLVLSLDYEIEGIGTGSLSDMVTLPTGKLLDVFDEEGARLTIMAEMGHYWAMKRYPKRFESDIELFEEQLKDAVKRGHDVQLHLHPQWFNSTFNGTEWEFEYNQSITGSMTTDYPLALAMLKKGKQDLENLLKPVNPEYQCRCYRQGWFVMQPSRKILTALKETGFVLDSSVPKGSIKDSIYVKFDYNTATSYFRPWKPQLDDICQHEPRETFLEFPIFSFFSRLPLHINPNFVNNRKFQKLLSKIFAGSSQSVKSVKRTKKASVFPFYRRSYQIDFTTMYSDLLYSQVNRIAHRKSDIPFVPLVLIGHSKKFCLPSQIRMFIQRVKKLKNVDFYTMSEAYERYIDE